MSKTLEELEGDDWGEAEDGSPLVQTCHALRRKPLDQFSTEDLRVMIGQDIGLYHLLPRAIDVLRENPLASGDLYEGDLLVSVLQCRDAQDSRADNAAELRTICTRVLETMDGQAAEFLFGGNAPKDFGLTDSSAAELVREKITILSSEPPFRDCILFLKTHGH
ncbi:contact-dependent growth inhibition system immunity protein [Nitratireductor sp. XY-223]|uniref:contact-dependent growth inhibition system immunity protein n=1 Tax=Nitratireductor sp. XY-223 TaxID=2561926 RepID=UPI0010AAD710|nr:contact-dependent growth inhibition system immunity protein [Nitratireductor sp. XY-223]